MRILAVIVLMIFLVTLKGQTVIELDKDLRITLFSENIYIVSHDFPWNSNSLIVNAGDGEIVFIDTPYHNEGTERIVSWAKKHLKGKHFTAVNTGFHIDNLGGNGFLREKGIDIYGSDLTIQLVKEKGKQTQEQIISWLQAPEMSRFKKVYENIQFVPPNIPFSINGGLHLKIGNYHFEVFYPGESHSPDNVTVYIPEKKILFGGCMVKSLESKNLGFTGDANLKEWPISVNKLKEKYPLAETVIPHHGNWGGLELLDHTLDLFKK